MSRHTTVSDAAGQLVDDAQALLAATTDIAEEKVIAARKRLSAAMKNGREVLEDFKDKARAGAKATDETIREHPYESIGIALGAGVLLGLYFGRRK